MDLKQLRCFSPTSNYDDPVALKILSATGRVYIAHIPDSKNVKNHWIERSDYFPAIQKQKDYLIEPPSSTDKPVSRHPALPAEHAKGG